MYTFYHKINPNLYIYSTLKIQIVLSHWPDLQIFYILYSFGYIHFPAPNDVSVSSKSLTFKINQRR